MRAASWPGWDAFERQLKRFDIKVSGAGSDTISKFFSTGDSAALFPEYVSRAVMQGVDESGVLSNIIASKTVINSLDYRTITTADGHDTAASVVQEGAEIPETVVKLKDQSCQADKTRPGCWWRRMKRSNFKGLICFRLCCVRSV